jgi:hypothetical protein
MEKGVTALDLRIRVWGAFGALATDVLRGNWWRNDAERYSKRESSSLGIDAAIYASSISLSLSNKEGTKVSHDIHLERRRLWVAFWRVGSSYCL